MSDARDADHRPSAAAELQAAWDEFVRPIRQPASRPGAPSDRDPMAPAAGDYEVLADLGVVDGVRRLEAWDRAVRRKVGIRTLATPTARDSEFGQEFLRRGQYAASQRHQHLLGVYGIDPQKMSIVTEPCRRSVADELAAGPLDPRRVDAVLAAALAGLDHLHRQGDVHGRLSIASLLIDDDGVVKLDFAVGRGAGDSLVLAPGQEKYAAPETLDEQRFGLVGTAADLYALGLVALELLAGEQFLAVMQDAGLDLQGGGDAWLRWHMSASARSPHAAELAEGVDSRLASTIDRMLAKRVSDRFATAGEALAALSSATPAAGPAPRQVPLPEYPTPVVANKGVAVRSFEPRLYGPRTERAIALPASAAIGAAPPKVKQLVDVLSDKKNANALAAAMVLIAAFVAGISFFASPIEVAETTPNPPWEEPVEPEPQPPAEPPRAAPRERTQRSKPKAKPVVSAVDKAPAAPVDGRIVVLTSPPDAWVEIDGQRFGGSHPAKSLPPGEHLIRAGRWDRLTYVQRVIVPSNATEQVVVKLDARPAFAPYEPVLVGGSRWSGVAAKFVKQLAAASWTPHSNKLTEAEIERQARTKYDRLLELDPRIAQGLAVAAIERGSYSNATRLYGLASRHAPAAYSWVHKGLVRSLLCEGRTDEALRVVECFAMQIQRETATGLSPTGEAYAGDAVRFLGRAIGFIDASDAEATALLRQKLEGMLSDDLLSAFADARDETTARIEHTRRVPRAGEPADVKFYLGDAVAGERLALAASLQAGVVAPPDGRNAQWRVVAPGNPNHGTSTPPASGFVAVE